MKVDYIIMEGKVGIGGIIFYLFAFMVLVSVPFTVYLLKSGQEQLVGASVQSNIFSAPPSFEMSIVPSTISLSENISISVKNQESNWYMIYASQDPSLLLVRLKVTTKKDILSTLSTVIYQGKEPVTFSYAPSSSGNALAVVFQLKNPTEDFRSGDTMCTWDGTLYIFRKNRENILLTLLQKDSSNNGSWEQLTTCTHSGPVGLIVN